MKNNYLDYLLNDINRRLKRYLMIYRLLIGKNYYNKKIALVNTFDYKKNYSEQLVIITIAFNNFEIIKQQYLYMEKFLQDKFIYVVVDNSNINNVSNLLCEFCKSNDIAYIKLPTLSFLTDPSYSHGQALNWSYKNIIKRTNPKYYGFIDHDIIPFKDTKITPLIKGGLLGPIREVKDMWYLWAGFCFFENKKITNKLNFLPYFKLNLKEFIYLDTGGSNFNKIYKNTNKNNINILKKNILT